MFAENWLGYWLETSFLSTRVPLYTFYTYKITLFSLPFHSYKLQKIDDEGHPFTLTLVVLPYISSKNENNV